jgi:hypothetical protein
MPTTKSTAKKTAKTSPKNEPRVRMIKPSAKRFGLRKRVPHPGPKLPSGFKILLASLKILRANWKKFAAIAAVYLLLSMLLVRGFGNADLPSLKQYVTDSLQGKGGQVSVGFTVFGLLLGTTGRAATEAGGVYQSLLFVAVTLTTIWALRQAHAGIQFGVKEAFYKAFTPLVPFLCVALVIGLQLVPFLLANMLYTVILIGGVAQTLVEIVIWAIVMLLLAIWSLYMLTASLLAVYIVTLPDMAPLAALRSARRLVRDRRWTVMRKVLFLPLIILVIGTLIMLPVIIFLAPAAEWVFVLLMAACIVLIHGYLYSLYRELL